MFTRMKIIMMVNFLLSNSFVSSTMLINSCDCSASMKAKAPWNVEMSWNPKLSVTTATASSISCKVCILRVLL